MDVVQNSIQAKAGNIDLTLRELPITEGKTADVLLEVKDDGTGMDEQTMRQALDPFYTDGKKHPGRRVGLGLPFLKQVLDETGGQFDLESQPGRGTTLVCRFVGDHLDTPPLGDLAGALMSLFSFPGDYELNLYRSRGDLHYEVSRSELREVLGDFESPQSLALLNEFLESQEEFHGETDP